MTKSQVVGFLRSDNDAKPLVGPNFAPTPLASQSIVVLHIANLGIKTKLFLRN